MENYSYSMAAFGAQSGNSEEEKKASEPSLEDDLNKSNNPVSGNKSENYEENKEVAEYKGIGKRLKFFLKRTGLNQSDIAKKMGMSQQTISVYCRTGKIPMHVLIAMESLFQLDIEWIRGNKRDSDGEMGRAPINRIKKNSAENLGENPELIEINSDENSGSRIETAEQRSNEKPREKVDGEGRSTVVRNIKKSREVNGGLNDEFSALESTFNALSSKGRETLLQFGKSLEENDNDSVRTEDVRHANFQYFGLIEVPFYGEIIEGDPIPVKEDWEGERIAIPSSILPNPNSENYFCLRAVGSSMSNCGIASGDYVVFFKSELIEQGQIAVVKVELETFVKRFFFRERKIEMKPCNLGYKTMHIPRGKYFKVEGVMVGFCRSRR